MAPQFSNSTGDAIDIQTRSALADIANDLRAMQTRYPQLTGIDDVVVTDSQLDYQHGNVVCQSKARPCAYSRDACRITVELSRLTTREQAAGRAEVSRVIGLRDGNFLVLSTHVLAERTAEGKTFAAAVQAIIDARLQVLQRQLAGSGPG